jgi:hypothetical protein
MSTLGPVTPVSGLRICGSCFGLHGESNLRRQLCACATQEEHRANGEARYQSSGTYWTRLAEICRCCGAALVTADHKYTHWFCGGCLKRVREVNEACGRCAIPVGWHSIVNGVFIPGNRCKTLIGATGAADELNAFFRETASVSEWGDRIVERRWMAAGLRSLGGRLGQCTAAALGIESPPPSFCWVDTDCSRPWATARARRMSGDGAARSALPDPTADRR